MKDTEKEKVLIVDDSALNRSILIDMLGEEYEIFEAGNGEDALQLLWKYGRDLSLVLLDLVMPKVNGFDVLEEMNRCGWMIAAIPVIVISTEKDNRSLNRAFDLGAVDFIERPFNIYSVQRRVQNILSERRRERELQKLVRSGIGRHVNRTMLLVEMLDGTAEMQKGGRREHSGMLYLTVHELLTEMMKNPHLKEHLTPDEADDAALAAVLYPAVETKLDGAVSQGGEERLLKMMRELASWEKTLPDSKEAEDDEDEPLWIQTVRFSELCGGLLYGTSRRGPLPFRDAEKILLERYQNAFDRSIREAFRNIAGKLSVQLSSSAPWETLKNYLEHVAEERYEQVFSVKD